MRAPQKLTDADIARLRTLAADGWSCRALGDKFGVTHQHISRILRDVQRASLAGLDAKALRSSVLGAVEAFLDGRPADDGDEVLGAMARVLAVKLDAVVESDSVAAATAAPRVALALVEVVARLQATGPREPDGLDRLRARREARLLLRAASGNGHPQQKRGSHEH